MKASDLKRAYEIQDSIEKIEHQINFIRNGHHLGITIQGTYQKDEFVDAIRPHVIDHMEKGVKTLKAKLKALGIEPE